MLDLRDLVHQERPGTRLTGPGVAAIGELDRSSIATHE